MTYNAYKTDKKDAGFTLVELAIVMIIIGLLVGGVLKGQELIANARITSTVSQVKGIEAATTTFRDMYDAMPGDITAPQVRLPNCLAAPCSQGGNGNGRLTDAPGAVQNAGTENFSFWSHLNAADLMTGVENSADIAWGGGLPDSDIGGGFTVGFTANGDLGGANAPGRGGHYMAIQGDPIAAIGGGSQVISASQAARIDRKMDDGLPNTGTVRAANDGLPCAAGGATDPYLEADDEIACAVYIRFQQ